MWYRAVVLVSATALLFFASARVAGSHESQESRNRYNNRGNCVKQDQNGNCPLKEGLHNASLQLSGSDQVNFNIVIGEIDDILANVSLTEDEQISQCGYKLRIFFKQYQSIALEIQFFQIIGFGSFNDFCDVAQQVDGEQTESLIIVDSDGDCDVTRALKHKCAAASSGMQLHECQWLVSQIHSVVTGSYDFHYKHVLIEEVFQEFEAQFGAADFEAFAEVQISSFGFLGQFRGVCKQFYRFANIHNLFVGGNNCAFLQGINASAQDSNAPWTRSERTQLLDFISNLQIFINDNSLSDFDKMKSCVHAFTEFLLTFEYMEARMRILIQIGADFNFGFFGDFLDCFSFMSVCQAGVTGVPGAPVSGATQVSGGFTQSVSQGFSAGVTGGSSQGVSQGATQGFTQAVSGGVSQSVTQGFTQGVSSGVSQSATQGFTQGVSGGVSQSATQGFTQGVSSGVTQAVTQFPTQSVSPGTPSSEAIGRFDSALGLVDCSHGGAAGTLLIQGLLNMASSLSGSDQTDWITEVQYVRDHIVCNASLSSQQQLIFGTYHIKGFCHGRISIKKIVQYLFIGSWGMLNDLFNVAIEFNGQSCQSVLVFSGGECQLTSSIESAISSFSLTVQQQSDCNALIADIKAIASSTSFSFSQIMVEIQIRFKSFFKIHGELEGQFRQIQIASWGSLDMFLDVSLAWFRFSYFEHLFSARAGQSQCIMANDMTNDCSNSSYGLTRAEQSSTLDLISNIQASSQQAGAVMTIAKGIVVDWQQFLKVNKFLFSIIREFSIYIEIEFGCFGDFLDCYDIMCVLNPSGTEVPSLPPSTPAATTIAPSTAAPTTVKPSTAPPTTIAPTTAAPTTKIAPTTAAPTTTTVATGNCNSAGGLFQLNNNHSIVVDSLYTGCNTFNGTQCTNFKPYILKIDNSVVRNTTLTSDAQRIHFFNYIITQYCGTNSLRLYFVMGVQMSNGWGNVQQLCGCDTTSG
ncbi:hypothetical protein QR680_015929 [Steinernema hermaphroditum]|uniref:Uncharacterized protein n=1 Tax=Steinernema hermaphroditum TaxID=289476 RepID=A0AA39LLQ7_9BILA|nr:hypothetical protein QR680_015929 [Steinernema hermaphroditum]